MVKWQDLEQRHRELSVLRKALISAPLLPSISSGVLHLWQGIESIFPSVDRELSFRVAFSIGQLSRKTGGVDVYRLAKKSYSDRSKIAHGKGDSAGVEEWERVWSLACACIRAIVARDCLPSEQELIEEAFSA
jgi:hypothetical protein